MPQRIPLEPSEALYRFSTTLENVDYIFDVHWNARDAAWYFDLLDIDENMIRAGNKIVLGALPGRRSSSASFPPGVFVVLDTSGSGVDASYEDLGVRIVMHYYTQEEFNAIYE
jgi:hypothetical protein